MTYWPHSETPREWLFNVLVIGGSKRHFEPPGWAKCLSSTILDYGPGCRCLLSLLWHDYEGTRWATLGATSAGAVSLLGSVLGEIWGLEYSGRGYEFGDEEPLPIWLEPPDRLHLREPSDLDMVDSESVAAFLSFHGIFTCSCFVSSAYPRTRGSGGTTGVYLTTLI